MSLSKTCTTCLAPKSFEEFVKDKRNSNGIGAQCKSCASSYLKDWYLRNSKSHNYKNSRWYKKNKEAHGARNAAWAARNPKATLKSHLKYQYGTTLDVYEKLLEEQQGLCAICRREETSKRAYRLSLDHCHKTGKVRGLLCRKCNTAVGMLKEDLDAAGRLVQYLKTHEEK